MQTRTIEANGFRFAVDETGEGDHLALCLHGFPESRFSWRYQAPALAAMGYRVWAPDLRGYGETEPKPRAAADYRLARLREDVAALIDASGAKKVTLIGHDWGAGLAWSFASHKPRPLERLVIMNVPHPAVMAAQMRKGNWAQLKKSWYIFFFQIPGLPEWATIRSDAAMVRQAFHGMAVDKTNFGPEVLDRYARDAQRPGAIRGMINWYRAALRYPDMSGDWPAIEVPTLIVWGEEDAALGVELLDGTDAYVRDLTIRRLPGVSHWVQQEAPAKVNAILEEWLPRAG